MSDKIILPIEDWIDSKYYLGEIAEKLSPFWREQAVNVVNGKFSEIIIFGSLGGGKTTFANIMLLRKLYELSRYENPQKSLGLLSTSTIAFMYFSVSMQMAKYTGFSELMGMLDSIPYFSREFRRREDVSSIIEFNKKIMVLTGSNMSHQIGLNVLGAVLDEANFYLAKDAFEKAKSLYQAISTRQLSRFVIGGKNLGLSILVSSADKPSAFVEQRIEAAKNRDDIYVITTTGYELKRTKYGAGEFVVFIGTGYLKPEIVQDISSLKRLVEWLGTKWDSEWERYPLLYIIKGMLPSDIKRWFYAVPNEFRGVFENDISSAIRDVIGVSVSDDSKLFRSTQAYKDAISGESIFLRDIIELSSHDEERLQDYTNLVRFVDRDKPRYIHIDLGLKKDRLGIAIVHTNGIVKNEFGVLPLLVVDGMVAVETSKRYKMEDEIPIWKIRDFLLWLKQNGLNIQKISFDSYQSADSIQLLRRQGFNVDLLSVDKTDEQYMNLVNLYLERRIKHPEHQLYRRELFALDWYREKNKVDHPRELSKDVADAVCGACWWGSKEFKADVNVLEDFISYTDTNKNFDLLDFFKQNNSQNKRRNQNEKLWDFYSL